MLSHLVLVVSLMANVLASCPPKYHLYAAERKCLKWVQQSAAYDGARTICQRDGGDLVQIYDDAKRDFIINVMRVINRPIIGVHDKDRDGVYTYADGTPLTDYRPWSPGQPEENTRVFCVNLMILGDHGWNGIDCRRRNRFICEKAAPPVADPVTQATVVVGQPEPVPAATITCPSSYTVYAPESTCLKWVQVSAGFDEARTICRRDGGDLVKIYDDAKRDFIINVMRVINRPIIGVHDKDQDGVYTYVDGTPLTDYRPWSPGQPEENTRVFCVNLMILGDHGWNGIDCRRRNRFICEIDKSPNAQVPVVVVPPNPVPAATITCPSSYTVYAPESTCLKWMQVSAGFDEARTICRRDGGDLVKIYDDAKRDFIINVMRVINRPIIGVHDKDQDGVYTYVDGTPLTDYRPWSPGQPEENTRVFCVNLMILGDHGWNGIDCRRRNRFICEIDKSPNAQNISQGSIVVIPPDPISTAEPVVIEPAPLPTQAPIVVEPQYPIQTVNASSTRPLCPPNYQAFWPDQTCLRWVQQPAAFDQARALCQMDGGDLVQIHTDIKLSFIINVMRVTNQPFIGVHDKDQDGVYTYVDGTPLSNYQPWTPGQPEANSEFCVNLLVQGNQKWNGFDCNRENLYICETDMWLNGQAPIVITPQLPLPVVTPQQPFPVVNPSGINPVCPQGYSLYQPDMTCLMWITSPATFYNALNYCRQNGGDLVTIQNDHKRDFIFDVMGVFGRIYIGVVDSDKDGVFTYVDGSPMTTYQPWAAGQPDNLGTGEYCVDIESTGLRGWHDVNCDQERRYIIQIDAILNNNQVIPLTLDPLTSGNNASPTNVIQSWSKPAKKWRKKGNGKRRRGKGKRRRWGKKGGKKWIMPPATNLIQPPVTNWVQPPVTDWVKPPVTNVVQPPATNLIQPPVTNWVQPPVTDWVKPPVTNFVQPPATNWAQPPVTNWAQPPVANWAQPPVTNWAQPPVTNFVEPPVTNWAQPPVTNWAQPPVTNWVQPPATNWIRPPVKPWVSMDGGCHQCVGIFTPGQGWRKVKCFDTPLTGGCKDDQVQVTRQQSDISRLLAALGLAEPQISRPRSNLSLFMEALGLAEPQRFTRGRLIAALKMGPE